MADSDELVSQFMSFTGSSDTTRALQYLEMSQNNVEAAVSLFMDHQGGGGGGDNAMAAAGGGGGGIPDRMGGIRAPDATQSMRLMDDGPSAHGYMHGGGYAHMMHQMLAEDDMRNSAFRAPSAFDDIRDTINAAAAADEDMEDMDGEYKYAEDDEDNEATAPPKAQPSLADMFAPPDNLIFKEGGFEGARDMAKDSKRWLLVNLQKDSEFSCHALNRDVWRDELVENLVRDGFIFWQSMDVTQEGTTYVERYKVNDYPHVAIIDPRTRRLMWRKEGWTQEKPLTAVLFAETVMDFCSRHTFDKPPQAPKPSAAGVASRPAKRSIHELSEQEQLEAAMRASLGDDMKKDDGDDDSSDEVEIVEPGGGNDSKPPAAPTAPEPEKKEPTLFDQLSAMALSTEPDDGARLQLRMPDGKRSVRKFDPAATVRTVYAYIVQSNEEAKSGKEFIMMAGFPPKDLLADLDNTIDSCQLSGQAITVRWK